MIRSFMLLLCSVSVSLAVPVLAVDCVVCPTAVEDSLIILINDYRAANGVPGIDLDRRLLSSARRHAADLAIHDFLSFVGTDGSTPEQRRSEAGYFATGASNVVVNSPGAAATFDLLQLSPEAIDNFLNPSLRHIGVAWMADSIGDATDAWTIDYGTGLDASIEPTCRTIYCPSGADVALLLRINTLRADSGLASLAADDRLVESAQRQACDMTTFNLTTDSSLTGLSSAERMLAHTYDLPGPTLTMIEAENPVTVFLTWLDDPGASQVLLDPALRHIGLGWAASGYGPVPHVWVADFGYSSAAEQPPDCDCCIGIRGNVDADLEEAINLTDLTALVNALFVTFEPPFCIDEANVSADAAGELSLSDLTILVNHLFVTFEPLPPCP